MGSNSYLPGEWTGTRGDLPYGTLLGGIPLYCRTAMGRVCEGPLKASSDEQPLPKKKVADNPAANSSMVCDRATRSSAEGTNAADIPVVSLWSKHIVHRATSRGRKLVTLHLAFFLTGTLVGFWVRQGDKKWRA